MSRNATSYEADYVGWVQEQVELLRSGALSELDAANLAEELDDMGRSIRHQLKNRLAVLIMHLLKWRYQPGFRSTSWSGTIREQRRQIVDLLEESPSLRPALSRDLTTFYRLGRAKAEGETGLPEATFPAECPYTPAQILDENFLPED